MTIGTNLLVGLVAVTAIGVTSTLLYREYQDMKSKVSELEQKLNSTESVADAQSKSGENKDEQAKATIAATAATGKLSRDVASLRKSVRELEQKSQGSIETCERSLTVAGEVFGECAERYSALAGRAEQMKIDHTATEKHVEILEGLISDLSGLEPIK